MEAALSGFYQILATQADHVRAWILKTTLSWPLLREAFRRRSIRLGTLFVLSCVSSLVVSLYLPLWVLAIGPAVYGVPHLFASLRYFSYTAEHGDHGCASGRRGQALACAASVMTLVAGYRLLITLNYLKLPVAHLSEWRGSTYLELSAMLLVFAGGCCIFRKSGRRILRGLLFLAPLVAAYIYDSPMTIGFLVLAHNFVAFIYWWLAAKTRPEKSLAAVAGLVMLGITAVIFMGKLDSFYRADLAGDSLEFALLSFADLGRMIVPWSDAPALWRHAAVAYAFGQAMHYFVWLKAIPDQHHHHEVPTSFRQSLSLLERDFGRKWAVRMITLSVVFASAWFVLRFPEARAIYFGLAGYHGYLEIAGVALVLST